MKQAAAQSRFREEETWFAGPFVLAFGGGALARYVGFPGWGQWAVAIVFFAFGCVVLGGVVGRDTLSLGTKEVNETNDPLDESGLGKLFMQVALWIADFADRVFWSRKR